MMAVWLSRTVAWILRRVCSVPEPRRTSYVPGDSTMRAPVVPSATSSRPDNTATVGSSRGFVIAGTKIAPLP